MSKKLDQDIPERRDREVRTARPGPCKEMMSCLTETSENKKLIKTS